MRHRAGFSLATLGERLGLSHQMIYWYETGESRISASTLYDLAACLGCTVGDFYAGLAPAVAGQSDSLHIQLADVLDTRSGADLVDGYRRVSDRVQDELAALVQILADGRADPSTINFTEAGESFSASNSGHAA